ncbi:MAG: DUF2249 domain-containing protein [Rhodanobacter sp.]
MSVALPMHSSIAAPAVVVPELDLRYLPAPEPMQRALDATDALLPGQSVSVLTPLLPTPLLEMLAARGLLTAVSPLPGGAARVLIHCPARDGAS